MRTTCNAEDFVSAHRDVFGLLGSNNALAGEPLNRSGPSPTVEFTRGNHFVFGFEQQRFGSRQSGTSLYWVEYGRPTRAHSGFRSELRQALSEVYELHGPLSITNSGNFISRAIVAEARAAGIPITLISVQIDDVAAPAIDSAIPATSVQTSWDGFAAFAEAFSAAGGCGNPWIALEAYHGQVSDRAHIFSNMRIAAVDHARDAVDGTVVGPSTPEIADFEETTAIDRWLLGNRRVGISHLFYWSPELIAAQLDSEIWRDAVRAASIRPPTMGQDPLRWVSWKLISGAFPNLVSSRSAEDARNNAEFSAKMKLLQRRLVRLNPGCGNIHYFPLHRFLDHFGIRYDFEFGDAQRRYGRVG